jgi:transcriptional regulator with XRE-family HTH domain
LVAAAGDFLYPIGEVTRMTFGDRLQDLRKARGLSQERLAEKIGVSRQAFAKWETGQSYPDIEKLPILGDYFKISIDKLLRDDNGQSCVMKVCRQPGITDDDVLSFLLSAKRNTYAGKGPEASPSRMNSHDFIYTENDLTYIDTYLGGERFAGEEALWRHDIPFWSMNYCGRVLSDSFSGDFLKECLLRATKEYPYRGPLVHNSGDYNYHCIINGSFDWFNGYEEIFCNSEKVYECVFHGGSVK